MARFLFILLILSSFSAVHAAAAEELYPEITRLDNGLYASQIPGRNLRLVMERVTKKNRPDWVTYIKAQDHPSIAQMYFEKYPNAKGHIADGTGHFEWVLKNPDKGQRPNERGVDTNENEVWVAYVTTDAHPRHIDDKDVASYTQEDVMDTNFSFPYSIKMAVTVVSSPGALATSNMGIFSTPSNLFSPNPETSLSNDLLAFSCAVMLKIDPQRKVMIHAPVAIIGRQTSGHLPPNSFFLGTREMENQLKRRLATPLENFDKLPKTVKEMKKLKEDWIRDAEKDLEFFNDDIRNSPKTQDIQTLLKKSIYTHIQWKDDQASINMEAINRDLEKYLRDAYKFYQNPYSLAEKPTSEASKEILALMKNYPPLISIPGSEENKNKIGDEIIVYDPDHHDKVLFKATRDHPPYDWMFGGPFRPDGKTIYTATRLSALANMALREQMDS